MTTTAERMTADEFLASEDSGPRMQLIAGGLVVTDPNWEHQQLVGELLGRLTEWAKGEDGSGAASLSIDVRMDDENVYKPDVLWYPASNTPARKDKRPYPLPDLAVEVRSPSTWRYDVGVKKAVYEQRGLRELWLVDGDAETVLVFRRSAARATRFDVAAELRAGEQLDSPLLPGFSLALSALLAI